MMSNGRSVPSGRVGNAKDAVFRSNEHFREAVREQVCCDAPSLSSWATVEARHARPFSSSLRNCNRVTLVQRSGSQMHIVSADEKTS